MGGGYSTLLGAARNKYMVPAAETLSSLHELLLELGAEVADLSAHQGNLYDEHVNAELVSQAYVLRDAEAIRSRASAEEREVFGESDEEFDPLEYGEQNREGTVLWHDVETMKILVVVVEKSATAEDRVGNFRVHGPGSGSGKRCGPQAGSFPETPGALQRMLNCSPLRSDTSAARRSRLFRSCDELVADGWRLSAR